MIRMYGDIDYDDECETLSAVGLYWVLITNLMFAFKTAEECFYINLPLPAKILKMDIIFVISAPHSSSKRHLAILFQPLLDLWRHDNAIVLTDPPSMLYDDGQDKEYGTQTKWDRLDHRFSPY